MAVIVCASTFAGCATVVQEHVVMPPRDLAAPVQSLRIMPFAASLYGAQLAEELKNQLSNEGYLQVTSQGGEATLSGTLTMGRVNYHEYRTSYQVERKDRGRTYTTTQYLYFLQKSLPVNVTYSVQKGNTTLGGNTISLPYKRESMGSSPAEARANAIGDEMIIQHQISALARYIVAGVSPHKELWSFKLQPAGNDHLKTGIAYYERGLYPQAEAYWSRVISETKKPEELAAAHYNVGVLKMREGRYEDAFKMFREADRLEPANNLYMDALLQVEKAGSGEQELSKRGITPRQQPR
jgi:tetratricopeptide (TPR) repeat protein